MPRDIIANLRRKPKVTDDDGYRLSLHLLHEWKVQQQTGARLASLYGKCRAS